VRAFIRAVFAVCILPGLGASFPWQASAPHAAAPAANASRSADAHYHRGVKLAQAGRDDEALQEFDHSIELDPTRFEAYKAIDDLLSRKRDWPPIIDHWTRYLQQVPNDGRAYLERGGTYSQLRNMASAVRDEDKACSLGIAEACRVAAIWRRNGVRAGPGAPTPESDWKRSPVAWTLLGLFALIPISAICWLVSYLRMRRRGVTTPGMFSAKEVSMQDGRLVLSTPRSFGFMGILVALVFVGVLVFFLFTAINSFKPLREQIGAAAFFAIFFVGVALTVHKYFPRWLRLAKKGEVVVFDRQRDVLLKDNQPLAHLSHVSRVQINMYVRPVWYDKVLSGKLSSVRPFFSVISSPPKYSSDRYYWTVSVFGRDDKELVEIGAGYQGEARNIAQMIADYTGTTVSSAKRKGSYF
jgi:hypothetical protein